MSSIRRAYMRLGKSTRNSILGSDMPYRLSDKDIRGLDSMLGFDYGDMRDEERIVKRALRKFDDNNFAHLSELEAHTLAEWKAVAQDELDPEDAESFVADAQAVKRYLEEWRRAATG